MDCSHPLAHLPNILPHHRPFVAGPPHRSGPRCVRGLPDDSGRPCLAGPRIDLSPLNLTKADCGLLQNGPPKIQAHPAFAPPPLGCANLSLDRVHHHARERCGRQPAIGDVLHKTSPSIVGFGEKCGPGGTLNSAPDNTVAALDSPCIATFPASHKYCKWHFLDALPPQVIVGPIHSDEAGTLLGTNFGSLSFQLAADKKQLQPLTFPQLVRISSSVGMRS